MKNISETELTKAAPAIAAIDEKMEKLDINNEDDQWEMAILREETSDVLDSIGLSPDDRQSFYDLYISQYLSVTHQIPAEF
jgi:hypothetical protein